MLFRSYPQSAQAVSIEVFLAGAVVIFAAYPEDVMREVVHPLNGLPGKLKYLPTLAEIKAECDAAALRQQREAEIEKARATRRVDPAKQRIGYRPPMDGAALRSNLLKHYGITDIPIGWYADDLLLAHHKHGAGLQAHIDEVIAKQRGGTTVQRSAFDNVADMARRARALRAEYEEQGLEPQYIGDDIMSLQMAERMGRIVPAQRDSA
jgi:hypothetical protein